MDSGTRDFDLEKLEANQVDTLSQQIGEKLRIIIDDACNKANQIVNIYGMQVKMQFLIEKIDLNAESKGE